MGIVYSEGLIYSWRMVSTVCLDKKLYSIFPPICYISEIIDDNMHGKVVKYTRGKMECVVITSK
jgi:hypothetical protein